MQRPRVNGKVTLRRAGRFHDIGLGTDLDVTVINIETGEILRELTINPDIDYQPRGITNILSATSNATDRCQPNRGHSQFTNKKYKHHARHGIVELNRAIQFQGLSG